MKWYSRFGEPRMHITDGGPHFKNEVIAELNRLTQTQHHYTHAYVPHANGTVEIVNRQLRRLIRIWNSEFQLTLGDWPKLVPLLQHVINFSTSSIHGKTPGYVFGGFESPHPIFCMFEQDDQNFREAPLSEEEIRSTASELIEALERLHRDINEADQSRRGKHRQPQNIRKPKKANHGKRGPCNIGRKAKRST